MVNEWWAGDEAQRFWMEITNRPDVRVDLNAPQRDGAGKESWTYSLVAATRPGDVVFHWHSDWIDTSALIGWSEIIGPLEDVYPYTWQARGTRGRARGVPTVGNGWRMPCGNFSELNRPIDASRLNERRDRVLGLGEELKRQHGTTYFPFSRYRDGIRAAQAYLTKFPVELLEVLPSLREAMIGASSLRPSNRHRGGVGRLQDPALRKAIEEHAVDVARKHYLQSGATKVEVLGKPYDLLVRKQNGDLHVEVKGSSLRLDSVTLTANEVTHARSYSATELFVVDEIEWKVSPDGAYTTSGGRQRLWGPWRPQDEDLTPIQYQYQLGSENLALEGQGLT